MGASVRSDLAPHHGCPAAGHLRIWSRAAMPGSAGPQDCPTSLRRTRTLGRPAGQPVKSSADTLILHFTPATSAAFLPEQPGGDSTQRLIIQAAAPNCTPRHER